MALLPWLRTFCRRLSLSSARRSRPLRRCRPCLEGLEDRTVPTFTASLSGGVLTFTSTTPGDKLILGVNPSNNLLVHNRLGDPGFNSAFDLDTSHAGDQTLSLSALTQLNISATGAGSTVDLTGLGTWLGSASLNAPNLAISANVSTATLNNTSLTLTGGGNYTLGSSVTAVSLFGGADNNTLDASAFSKGSVILDGGDGNDTLEGGTGSGGNIFNITGTGTKTITGAGVAAQNSVWVTRPVNMTATEASSIVSLTVGTDTSATISGVGVLHLTTTSLTGNVLDCSGLAADVSTFLTGGTGPDTLKGGAGTNVLSGGGGPDVLIGLATGTNTVSETADASFTLANNLLSYGASSETLTNISKAILTGGENNNTFTLSGWTGGLVTIDGGGGTNQLIENANVDTMTLTNTSLTTSAGLNVSLSNIESAWLIGGASTTLLDSSGFTVGAAILDGGTGNDTLRGGSGQDLFVIGQGTKTVIGANNLHGATDNTISAYAGAGFDANMTLTNTQLVMGGFFTDSLTNIQTAQLRAGNGGDILDASAFTAGNVSLFGGTGNDTLKGGSGNNTITVGGGQDTVNGGSGTSNTVVFNGDVDMVLTNTSLTLGGVVTTLTGIQNALLGAGANNHTITVTGWTHTGSLSSGGGVETIVDSATGNFNLSSTALSVSSGGVFQLHGLFNALLSNSSTAASIFTVSNWSGVATLLGNSGLDTFNVTFKGSGSGAVTVGESGSSPSGVAVLNAVGGAASGSYIVTGTVVQEGSESITYSGVKTIDVTGGNNGNAFWISGTPSGASVNVNTGGGNDTITVTSALGTWDTFHSPVNLDAGGGINYLTASEAGSTANDQLVVTSNFIGSATAAFSLSYQATGGSFGYGVNIQTGSGTNEIAVLSTAAGGPTTINAGAGTGIFNIASQTGPLTLGGPLYINGGAGGNYLGVSETNDTAPDLVFINTGSISSQSGSFTIFAFDTNGGTFSAGVGVALGSGGNIVYVLGTPPGAFMALTTGAGDDTVYVGSAAGTLAGFNSFLSVDEGAGSNLLRLSAAGDTVADNYYVTSTYFYSTAHQFALVYTATGGTFATGLDLFTGTGADFVGVYSTVAGTVTGIFTSGNDNVVVSSGAGTLDGYGGFIYVASLAGSDSLLVSDYFTATPDNLAVTSSGVYSGNPARPLAVGFVTTGGNFNRGVTVLEGAGDDNTMLYSQAPGVPLTIGNAGSGNDVTTVLATPTSDYNVFLSFGTGSDQLVIEAPGSSFAQDFPTSTGGTYAVAFPGLAPQYIGYLNAKTVTRIS